jgi:glycosyltransferase involved in cell wall biosynthesis
MATGIPVIASGQAGASEVIEHGRTGFVVDDPSSADEIASHLTRLIADPTARAAMGRAAREAMKTHDWDTVAAQTLRVYDRALVRR